MDDIKIIEAAADERRVGELIAIQHAHAAAHTPPASGHALGVGRAPGGVRFFLALSRSRPVGIIGLAALEPGLAEVKTMHVIEGERGKGIADQLLETLETKARASGARELRLETGRSEGFAASRRFYERMGFKPIERFGRYGNDPFSFCMAKPL